VSWQHSGLVSVSAITGFPDHHLEAWHAKVFQEDYHRVLNEAYERMLAMPESMGQDDVRDCLDRLPKDLSGFQAVQDFGRKSGEVFHWLVQAELDAKFAAQAHDQINGNAPDVVQAGKIAFANWKTWAATEKLDSFDTAQFEVDLSDKQLGLSARSDLIATKADMAHIYDWKSSNKIYAGDIVEVSMYAGLYQRKERRPVERAVLVRCSKEQEEPATVLEVTHEMLVKGWSVGISLLQSMKGWKEIEALAK